MWSSTSNDMWSATFIVTWLKLNIHWYVKFVQYSLLCEVCTVFIVMWSLYSIHCYVKFVQYSLLCEVFILCEIQVIVMCNSASIIMSLCCMKFYFHCYGKFLYSWQYEVLYSLQCEVKNSLLCEVLHSLLYVKFKFTQHSFFYEVKWIVEIYSKLRCSILSTTRSVTIYEEPVFFNWRQSHAHWNFSLNHQSCKTIYIWSELPFLFEYSHNF
jgi:hypothetical protein